MGQGAGDKGRITYLIGTVLDERISTWLSLHDACFVKEEVEFGNFTELGEYLKKRISKTDVGGTRDWLEIHDALIN